MIVALLIKLLLDFVEDLVLKLVLIRLIIQMNNNNVSCQILGYAGDFNRLIEREEMCG